MLRQVVRRFVLQKQNLFAATLELELGHIFARQPVAQTRPHAERPRRFQRFRKSQRERRRRAQRFRIQPGVVPRRRDLALGQPGRHPRRGGRVARRRIVKHLARGVDQGDPSAADVVRQIDGVPTQHMHRHRLLQLEGETLPEQRQTLRGGRQRRRRQLCPRIERQHRRTLRQKDMDGPIQLCLDLHVVVRERVERQRGPAPVRRQHRRLLTRTHADPLQTRLEGGVAHGAERQRTCHLGDRARLQAQIKGALLAGQQRGSDLRLHGRHVSLRRESDRLDVKRPHEIILRAVLYRDPQPRRVRRRFDKQPLGLRRTERHRRLQFSVLKRRGRRRLHERHRN